MKSLPKWARLFEVIIGNSYVRTSCKTDKSDVSIDQIFYFAIIKTEFDKNTGKKLKGKVLTLGDGIFLLISFISHR